MEQCLDPLSSSWQDTGSERLLAGTVLHTCAADLLTPATGDAQLLTHLLNSHQHFSITSSAGLALLNRL